MTFHSTSLTTGSGQGRRCGAALTPLTFIFPGDLWGSSSASSLLRRWKRGEGRDRQRSSQRRGATRGKKVNKRQRGGAEPSPAKGSTPPPPPRAAGTQGPRGQRQPCGRQRAARAARSSPVAPRPRPLASSTPVLNSEPGHRAPQRGRRRPAPRVPRARSPGLRPAAPRLPRLGPRPASTLGPSARPGPAAAAAECHGAIALPPSLCTVSGRRRALRPEGQGPRPAAGARGAREGRRRGRGGGGEAAGQGVGGEGRGAAPPRRRLPRPPQLFVQPAEERAPSLRALHRLGSGGRAAELGAGSPELPAPPRAEANLAARAAPQPFSRGAGEASGRGGGCGGGGGSCSCCRCSTTRPFPCARRTACLAPPSPPPKLPTAPGPRAAAPAATTASSIQYPPLPSLHLPTAGEVRAVSRRVLRPTDPRGPPSRQHHSRPRQQFLRPVPHSPDLLPQSTK